jgi:Repeat of unknown function (DUF5648)
MNKLISICVWISLLVSAPTLAQKSLPVSPFIQLPLSVYVHHLVELHNTGLDHYFYVDKNSYEYQAIKDGYAGSNWTETGKIIGTVTRFDSERQTPLYRFYGSVFPGPNSHFFTTNQAEYEDLVQLQARTPATQKRWNHEPLEFGDTVRFAKYVASADGPSSPTKGCDVFNFTTEFVRILRLYNDGFARGKDSNHRFVLESDVETIATMTANGWKNEGIAFCARVPLVQKN